MSSCSISSGIICIILTVICCSCGQEDADSTFKIETVGSGDGWKLTFDHTNNVVGFYAKGMQNSISCTNAAGLNNGPIITHHNDTSKSFIFSTSAGLTHDCCVVSKEPGTEFVNSKCFLVSPGKKYIVGAPPNQSTTSIILITLAITMTSIVAVFAVLAIFLRKKVKITFGGSRERLYEVASEPSSINNAPTPPPREIHPRRPTIEPLPVNKAPSPLPRDLPPRLPAFNGDGYVTPDNQQNGVDSNGPEYMQLLPHEPSPIANADTDQGNYEVIR